MSIRDHKRKARRQLHQAMAVPALYIPVQGATPVPCTVRVHTKYAALGLPDNGGAERAEAEPHLIFLASEVSMLRPKSGVVSVEPGEAYRIEAADPVDDCGFIKAKVSALPAAGTIGLPLPVDYSTPAPAAGSHGIGVLDVANMTGHAVYTHMGAQQRIAPNVETWLQNDRGTVDETQKPTDIPTFYNGTTITGRAGDGLGGEIRISFTPEDDEAAMFAVSLDIGGAGRVFSLETPISQGAGIEHKLRIPLLVFMRATWAANGAKVLVMSDGPGVIGRVQYVLHRLHKAR